MEPNKIPTAQDFYRDNESKFSSVEEAMREFTKLHIEEALQIASRNYAQGSLDPSKSVSIKDAILNSYPLTNIK